jgi:hypothetical protein
MKHLILITTLFLSSVTFSKSRKEISIPDHWEIVSVNEDTTILKGFSRIKILVIDKDYETPLEQVKIFMNTDLLIGITDSSGTVKAKFPYGSNKFCADTKEGNNFTANNIFLDQHYYVVKVRMGKYLSINPDGNELFEIADKPVIYLYPEKKQNTSVKVIPKNDFLFTYPKYPENGWEVTAYPSGKIDYNNKSYNYLFWEGTYSTISDNEASGFIVKSDTIIEFLENVLTKIGLNSYEQADFITYWGPKLMKNEFNYIHFYFNEQIEKHIAKLNVSPNPESIIRVFMTYHGTEKTQGIRSQQLPSYKRNGFTVVEWGGSNSTH